MTDGFELLVEAHRDIAQRLERYAAEPDDALVRQTVEELTVHGAMEEEALYPQLRRLVDDGDDLADEAEAEHAAVRTVIARIELSTPENLRPLVDELRTMVEQHVRAEEASLFPAMREAGVDSEDLGHRLNAARAAILSRTYPHAEAKDHGSAGV